MMLRLSKRQLQNDHMIARKLMNLISAYFTLLSIDETSDNSKKSLLKAADAPVFMQF